MSEKDEPYRVLARKYRPQNFNALIGQDALVRTLKNAITSGRIAHAFMLTGVRGVGKTTTARIIAKALNYTGADGTAGPTTESTDDCSLCQAISEDRHPDVIEMDAASRTGVDDIREILDGVRYAPTEARYKIYVIDEVHMLSKNAFNALLKTLEEPPEHVKFIFATTEIRKVPITVLSRCQRFDLQRVGSDLLVPHFKNICDQEEIKCDNDALSMIARAADGSVRDGLSLLDQAIALSGEQITVEQIQNMLGLADRAQNLDLLEHALKGRPKECLDIMDHIHKSGGAPVALLQDLLDLTHLLTKLRAVPDLGDDSHVLSGEQFDRAKTIATTISMPSLSKTWQILLKGLDEVQNAPHPQKAAEMVVMRLIYAANLPDPSDLVKKLKETNASHQSSPLSTVTPSGSHGATAHIHTPDFTQAPTSPHTTANHAGQEIAHAQPHLSVVPDPVPIKAMKTIDDIITLLKDNQELVLANQLYHFAHTIKLEHTIHGEKPHGQLIFRPEPEALPKLAQDLGTKLKDITGHHWMIAVSKERGQATPHEIAETNRLQELAQVAKMPVIENVLTIFPVAQLV